MDVGEHLAGLFRHDVRSDRRWSFARLASKKGQDQPAIVAVGEVPFETRPNSCWEPAFGISEDVGVIGATRIPRADQLDQDITDFHSGFMRLP